MAASNSERISKALELMRNALAPFVERELKNAFGSKWENVCKEGMPEWKTVKKAEELLLDPHIVLSIMQRQWIDVFGKILGQNERSYVFEIQGIRNRWAHQENFSYDDTDRAMDTIYRLINSISAAEAEELAKMRQEIRRTQFSEQRRVEERKKVVVAIKGAFSANLKPWREVVTPHRDVSSGNFQQAEFAADLAQVQSGKSSIEYGDPAEFFRRTYLTAGLSELIADSLKRLSGTGGPPVVELQTNFGGGKTHSMLALYHLFSGAKASELSGIDQLLSTSGIKQVPKANRAVLVGTALNPGEPHAKGKIKIHTLWGELAWQLGGDEGYGQVSENDRNGTSPGSDLLCKLFEKYSPCLILIDEWLAYVRQTYSKNDLPAGSFDANMTFAQAITEASKRTSRTLLVASIPASDIEVGGEGGREALTRIKNTFARIQSTWRPADRVESYEIVRRRLFEPVTEKASFAARDAVIKAFQDMYRKESGIFPSECNETGYGSLMEKAYPIHPELFERLYEDWGSLERFQRTRGVLRFMSAVIAELWAEGDSNLMIMPSSVPIDAPQACHEIRKVLEDNWQPVMERDVDGSDSLPRKIDSAITSLGRLHATRRVSRTIFVGSAPLYRAQHRGITDNKIKLGCVQPGETTATFTDALRRLTDSATFLYSDGQRYWFSTQPSVSKLARDRAEQADIHDVWMECTSRLRKDRQRGEFESVHHAPVSGEEIPDMMEARLVVLQPAQYHVAKDAESPAKKAAMDILMQRGNSPRLYRNTLVFLAPDKTNRDQLERTIRNHLAWKSICDDKESLNLDAHQIKQAELKENETDDAVNLQIRETYIWLICPGQQATVPSIELSETRLAGNDPVAIRVCKKMQNEELLITKYSAARLRMDLDSFLWKDKNHITVKQLWEYYASYLYLSRLKNREVLLAAIEGGVANFHIEDNFAIADAFDEKTGRYINLKAMTNVMVSLDTMSVIVKPEIAEQQIKADERKAIAGKETEPSVSKSGHNGESSVDLPPDSPIETKIPKPMKRFHGSKQVSTVRIVKAVQEIFDEVIQHISSLPGADVEITIQIQAKVPDGIPEEKQRIVRENTRALGFTSSEFEEE